MEAFIPACCGVTNENNTMEQMIAGRIMLFICYKNLGQISVIKKDAGHNRNTNYLPAYAIFQMVPLLSSDTYKAPSGPCANPQGRVTALWLVANAGPAKPLANTSHLPEGRPFLNGTNTTK